jgi:hypothetical protein
MACPYHLVIERQEYELYSFYVKKENIIVLPFANLGQGSIPARNFVWEHAISSGAFRHWILDDNLNGFYRLNHNLKTPCKTPSIFRAAEDFVDRYENVAIAGFQYFMFCSRKCELPPLALNTRIYSCILLRNDLPYRWRGRYNEDTDLSIRALKDGWVTVLFNAFLCFKETTMTMEGGNTAELYRGDGRLKMAESLCGQHPDIVKITRKWNRWQHQVDYSGFTQKLKPKEEWYRIPPGTDNYGMVLEVDDEADVDRGARAEPQGAAD